MGVVQALVEIVAIHFVDLDVLALVKVIVQKPVQQLALVAEALVHMHVQVIVQQSVFQVVLAVVLVVVHLDVLLLVQEVVHLAVVVQDAHLDADQAVLRNVPVVNLLVLPLVQLLVILIVQVLAKQVHNKIKR